MTVIEGGFQCLYMQIASGKMGDPNDANKPHRRQLGVGESGNCMVMHLRILMHGLD